MSGFWNTWRVLKISKCYTVMCKCQSILYFIHFNNVITKHWNIWYITRGGWIGFYCFLTNIFLITFKYLQNMAILCFQFVKFPWKKINMLRADEDGFFLTNFCYIFSNANGIEKPDRYLLTKISNFVQFNSKKHLLQCKVKHNDETIKI